MASFQIDNDFVGDEYPTYFIAEIGSNFDGDLVRAKALIKLAKESGADAVKFQHYTASSLVSGKGFETVGQQLSHQSNWKSSVFDTYENASLNSDWTQALAEYSQLNEISFFTSPYSFALTDLVHKFVPAYKIGSGDITYHDLLHHIAKKEKPILLATGASTLNEVDRAVNIITNVNKNICVMQCNTNYENSFSNFSSLNLNVIKSYKEKYPNAVIGLSDHTQGHLAVLAGVALGARVIEKHFTDDTEKEGPDHSFAMDSKAWQLMVKEVRILEKALGDGNKKVESNEIKSRIVQRRGICLTMDLQKGHLITGQELDYLRPLLADGFHPYEKNSLVGKRLTRSMVQGEMVLKNDIK
ncbi:N-acetylneuraminate synthase family protein [Alphaproteobacteria bacterium]|nr:N-acetylneuraminate synthase family protein [Alphaproteobacteria bacterium]